MTRATRCTRRAGFTLIELLVVMAVIVTLSSIALVVVPNVLSQDRTTDGATMVRQQLMIAKARATRDNAPRGIRFVVGADPTNPAKNPALCTELQHVEQPDPIIPAGWYIEFVYPADGPGPTAGQVTPANRECYLMGAPPDVGQSIADQISLGLPPTLRLPTITAVHTEPGATPGIAPQITAAVPASAPRNATTDRKLTLDATAFAFLDSVVGAGAQPVGSPTQPMLRTYLFAIQPQARPLLGEPNILLPKGICVDLPSGRNDLSNNSDPVVMFLPSGQVKNIGAGQLNLWVRDYTKNGGNPAVTPMYAGADFGQGGEQQVVSLKTKTGALGVFPISWTAGDPFEFTRTGSTSP